MEKNHEGLQFNLSERDIRSVWETPGAVVQTAVRPGNVRRGWRDHRVRDSDPGGGGCGQVYPGGASDQLPQIPQRQTGTGNTKTHQLLLRSSK